LKTVNPPPILEGLGPNIRTVPIGRYGFEPAFEFDGNIMHHESAWSTSLRRNFSSRLRECIMSTRTHLDTIFRKRFTKPFRRVAEWRKARQLERQMRASRLSKVQLEPLEQRVLLSADLNVVIDGFLDTLNPAVPQPAQSRWTMWRTME
jgi:hypothetical protein